LGNPNANPGNEDTPGHVCSSGVPNLLH